MSLWSHGHLRTMLTEGEKRGGGVNKEGIESRKREGHVSLLYAASVILMEERGSGLLLCT